MRFSLHYHLTFPHLIPTDFHTSSPFPDLFSSSALTHPIALIAHEFILFIFSLYHQNINSKKAGVFASITVVSPRLGTMFVTMVAVNRYLEAERRDDFP